MITIPRRPHELHRSSRGNLSCCIDRHIIPSSRDIASNSTRLEQAISHGSIVVKFAGYFVETVFRLVLVGIPGIYQVFAEPDLLDISVGGDEGKERGEDECGLHFEFVLGDEG